MILVVVDEILDVEPTWKKLRDHEQHHTTELAWKGHAEANDGSDARGSEGSIAWVLLQTKHKDEVKEEHQYQPNQEAHHTLCDLIGVRAWHETWKKRPEVVVEVAHAQNEGEKSRTERGGLFPVSQLLLTSGSIINVFGGLIFRWLKKSEVLKIS